MQKAEREVTDSIGGIPRLDVNDILCPNGTCVVRLNGEFVYSDVEHMYDQFAMTLTPQVVTFLSQMMQNIGST